MKRILAISVAIACLTGVAARGAQDDDADGAQDDEFARAGWYLGAYGVYAFEAYRETGIDFDDSFGANFRIGYRGNEWFALEGELEWIRDFEPDSPWGQSEIRTLIGGANAKFFPLSGRFQPYGLVGVNGMHVTVKDSPPGFGGNVTDFAFRFGLGLDIYATRNVVLGLEASYVWGVGDVWDLDYVSTGAGILFRF
jgi:opacity protein-like surface antigen